jgi:hypothetical protein
VKETAGGGTYVHICLAEFGRTISSTRNAALFACEDFTRFQAPFSNSDAPSRGTYNGMVTTLSHAETPVPSMFHRHVLGLQCGFKCGCPEKYSVSSYWMHLVGAKSSHGEQELFDADFALQVVQQLETSERYVVGSFTQ